MGYEYGLEKPYMFKYWIKTKSSKLARFDWLLHGVMLTGFCLSFKSLPLWDSGFQAGRR